MTRTLEPVVVNSIATDPRIKYRDALLNQGVHGLLVLPLVLRGTVIGWISVRRTQTPPFHSDQVTLARALSYQMTLAVQLARLAKQEQQATLINERNRMAREIHDTLAQGFTGIVIQLEAAEDVLEDEPEEAHAHLEKARSLARDSLAEARRSVWALHPEVLESTDLADALEQIVMQLTENTTIQTHVKITGEPHRLSQAVESNLLRIGQEAITNALKYGQATTIQIKLDYTQESVALVVRDDGRGMDTTLHETHNGFGLISMRERAEHLGGTFSFSSQLGQGTTVRVIVPTQAIEGKHHD
jgi:signal transduction histidine kinase